MPDGRVRACLTVDAPEVGPPIAQNTEGSPIIVPGPIDWRGPTETSVLNWSAEDGMHWIEMAGIDDLRARRIEAMSAACAQQIVAGFMCDALGADFLYPAKPQDQANLTASFADSLIEAAGSSWTTQFWCADAAGAWEFRDHTVAQIQQVGRAGKAAILAAMGKNELLRRQIDAASTAAEIESITW